MNSTFALFKIEGMKMAERVKWKSEALTGGSDSPTKMQDVSLMSKERIQVRLSLSFLPALLAGLSQLLRPSHKFSSIRCLLARRDNHQVEKVQNS